MTDQTNLDLIRTLATELAIALEHYEDDPARWQPEAVAAVRAGADALKASGRALPVPIYLVITRADAGGDPVSFDRAAMEAAGVIEADPVAEVWAGGGLAVSSDRPAKHAPKLSTD